MEVTMLLCDFAEAINGKLYILGGGWTHLRGTDPISCALGVYLAVPWTQTNQKHTLSLELLDQDGNAISGPEGNAVRVDGEFEVGRPPGAVPGDPIATTMAFRFIGLELQSGGYRFSFKIDGTELAKTQFRVHRPSEAA